MGSADSVTGPGLPILGGTTDSGTVSVRSIVLLFSPGNTGAQHNLGLMYGKGYGDSRIIYSGM